MEGRPTLHTVIGVNNVVYWFAFRFVVVCGDGEYIIYTAMALRNKAFGSGQEFVWAADSSQYAVRESASTVKVFKNFKERKAFKPDFGAEAIFGGYLLGVKSPSGLSFFDWDSLELVRRIEIQPKSVFWNESGELVAITTEESYFVLSYDQGAVAAAAEAEEEQNEDGIEAAFDVSVTKYRVEETGLCHVTIAHRFLERFRSPSKQVPGWATALSTPTSSTGLITTLEGRSLPFLTWTGNKCCFSFSNCYLVFSAFCSGPCTSWDTSRRITAYT